MSTYPISSQYGSFGNTCPVSGEDDEVDWAMIVKPVPWVVLGILKVLKSTNGIPIFGEICVLLSKRLNCLVFNVLLNTWGFNRGGKSERCFLRFFSSLDGPNSSWQGWPEVMNVWIFAPSRRSWRLTPSLSQLGLQVPLVARPARALALWLCALWCYRIFGGLTWLLNRGVWGHDKVEASLLP